MPIGFIDKAKVDKFRNALNEDAEFRLAALVMNSTLLLRVDTERCFITIGDGEVTDMIVAVPGEPHTSHASISASEHVWAEMLKAVPAPGYFDIAPAVISGRMELAGDMVLLDAYRHAIARIIWIFRELESGVKREFVPQPLPPAGTIEPIVGRYVYVEVAGITYRIYFEESGNPDGIPLICQHTAGTDCRQWRRLLNDPDVQARYRVIAHDLPYHGKSLPPEGIAWWTKRYVLDEELALGFPVALARALKLDRPVYMGASIGGMISIDLGWKHKEVFRAVIACEIGENMSDWAAGIPALFEPRRRNQSTESGYCQSPSIPVQNMHENNWLNDCCAYGVAGGDVNYYTFVHDLSDKYDQFDTTKTAVYIMNGEYDLATPPEFGDQIAAKIPGAKSIAMIGLGHFPHSEDYPLFKTYLDPVLNEIAEKGAK